MERVFDFCGSGKLLFDDTKSVKELIRYAFDTFDYYEPAGMEIVTLFQPRVRTRCGWFTTDTSLSCAEEIVETEWLCFAYHMPNVFYFAEGGWGHHMIELGNHPQIDAPVSLKLRFEDFDNSVIINGNYTLQNVMNYLKKTEYVPNKPIFLKIWDIYEMKPYENPYIISSDDKLMRIPLTEFEKVFPFAGVDICWLD